jgi:D-beta-D-heptose 7-phosphate kinase/D-beta-D-heptose 1-phosphate adenosyltransferase
VNYILFTGGFDPIHSGHLAAMEQAAHIGTLVVAPNSDNWLTQKKGAPFQPLSERVAILKHCKHVSEVQTGWDDSDGTACGAIQQFYTSKHLLTNGVGGRGNLFFANGGDRTPTNVSQFEIDLCIELGILLLFNVGGKKTQSSSQFIQEWSRRI